MAQQNASGFDTNAHVRRSTVMTGLVDYTLLITTVKLIKTFVDAGPKTANNPGGEDYYYLLVSITSLLLIVLVAMLVLTFLIFGPNIKSPVEEFEKTKHLRAKIDQFRSRYKIDNPSHTTEHRDDEVLEMFIWNTPRTTANPEETTPTTENPVQTTNNKKEYYEKVIAEYRKNFPNDKRNEAQIWLDLKDTLKQYKKTEPVKRTEIMNDAISGLSGIVLVMMILIEAFSGEGTFKTVTN